MHEQTWQTVQLNNTTPSATLSGGGRKHNEFPPHVIHLAHEDRRRTASIKFATSLPTGYRRWIRTMKV